MWFVYILYSAKPDKYYVGRTENVELRLKFHNNPIGGRKFTARKRRTEVVQGLSGDHERDPYE